MEGITAIFVPSEDFVTNRWNSIKQRFSFAESISETADVLITFFRDTAFNEPPKVYINLGFAESKYDYGAKTYCLDMSWYERYKPTVDALLSAWIWICFIWRVYVRLPGIINGVSSDFEVASNYRDYSAWSNGTADMRSGYKDSFDAYRAERRRYRTSTNWRKWGGRK